MSARAAAHPMSARRRVDVHQHRVMDQHDIAKAILSVSAPGVHPDASTLFPEDS